MKMSLSLTTATALLSTALTAHAGAIYDYSINNPGGKAKAGDVKNIATRFDSNTNALSWSYTIEHRSDAMRNDAFWLVLNDGPNPKGIAGQLAILYGDLQTNTLQAFEYNGTNGNKSYADPANFLASWNGAMNIQDDPAGLTTVSFDIDASNINNADLGEDWEGISFAEKIGIWFHPSARSSITYDDETGQMISYAKRRQSYHDSSDANTEVSEVPEPATLTLLGAGVAGLMASRRRTKG
jgi:hypothetical protein